MKRNTFAVAALSLLAVFSLAGCSSGGDAGTTAAGGGRGGAEFGFLTLSITDAPVDNAAEVRVQIDGVELMPASASTDQDAIPILFNEPVSIDLLALQGPDSKALLSNEILPSGSYHWLKLKLTAVNDGVLDSYVRLNDGTVHELEIPNGDASGLQINDGVEIIANKPSAKTIVFDLRKSLDLSSPGDFKLKPALNLVNDNETGSIKGKLRLEVLLSPRCSDRDPATGNAVYLYQGRNIVPDDIGSSGAEPFASAPVELNDATGQFEYRFDHVPFGRYTAAFTCEADLDLLGSDDPIRFTTTRNLKIKKSGTRKLGKNTFRFANRRPVARAVQHDDD